MERLRREEEAAVSAARENEQSGQTVRCLEQELAEKLEEVQALQVRGCGITASYSMCTVGAGQTICNGSFRYDINI